MSSIILGISAYYHDSAAALVRDGKIIAAAQEERFTRLKHDPAFPKNAIVSLCNQTDISLADIETIIFYEKPLIKFERILKTSIANAPLGFENFKQSMQEWIINQKLLMKKNIKRELASISNTLAEKPLLFSAHHLSHAASAFYPSPFEKAIVLCLDGVGEFETTSVWLGEGAELKHLKSIDFPHSLGLFYSTITQHCGFKVNSGEYKLMGLAPYGKPKYLSKLQELLHVSDDGSFALDMRYFEYCKSLKMTSSKLAAFLDIPVRLDGEDLKPCHMDLAASAQKVIENIILKICINLRNEFDCENLCMSGGVALNCVSNGKILKSNTYKNIWVQPASGDAGGAIGAALVAYYASNKIREVEKPDSMGGSYLGKKYSNNECSDELKTNGVKFDRLDQNELIHETAQALCDGKAIGWFQGRSEFGPRALGARSILADPRDPNMQRTLNLKIKFRESFRPFAPIILIEECENWFETIRNSPYMMFVDHLLCNKKTAQHHESLVSKSIPSQLAIERSVVPAITHVDYSARVQTISKKQNPLLHKLLSVFHEKTGCPLLVNTSFNVRGEPIVETPSDAIKCFFGTDLDILALGNSFVRKTENNNHINNNYKSQFAGD